MIGTHWKEIGVDVANDNSSFTNVIFPTEQQNTIIMVLPATIG
jgi:hypothetical protein